MYKAFGSIVCFFSVFLPASSTAHQDTALPKSGQKEYVKRMTEYLSVKLSVSDNVEAFEVKTDAIRYDLRPNDKLITKFSFNYRFISFSLSAAPAFIRGNKDNHLKGTSKYTNYALVLNFTHWVQELSYTRSRGYYLENTPEYRRGWVRGSDPYIQFPHLVYQSFHGQTGYKFNKNFSFNALSTQTERQLKSAGTFLPFFSYRYYIVDDRTPLTGQGQSQKSHNLELLASASYYYTLVLAKRIYASAGAGFGAGYIFSKLSTRTVAQTRKDHYSNAIYRMDGAIALGYNSERFFAGTQVSANSSFYSRSNVKNVIENDKAYYQLFVGYRLVAPALLKRLLDSAEEKRDSFLKKKG